jgi:hypothetical protein
VAEPARPTGGRERGRGAGGARSAIAANLWREPTKQRRNKTTRGDRGKQKKPKATGSERGGARRTKTKKRRDQTSRLVALALARSVNTRSLAHRARMLANARARPWGRLRCPPALDCSLRSVPLRSASLHYAPLHCGREALASRSVPLRSTTRRLAIARSVPLRSASLHYAPLRSRAPFRSVPLFLRSASLHSGTLHSTPLRGS